MANILETPKYIITGKDSLIESGNLLKSFGKKALIVTDNIMVQLKNVEKVEDVLKSNGIDFVIYSEVNSEPTDIMVDNGLKAYKENNCDFLIAIGGGSPIDCMKAIGAMVTNPGVINDYNGKELVNKPPVLVAIPTTAGTGSETTKVSIITDTVNNIKMLLKGGELIPTLAIVDPVFTLTVPKAITAATGVDALTHAIEAYTSRRAFPLADTFAISAIKKLYTYLPIAYKNGSDFQARELVAIAATEAGIAFNNSSVTIVHGMSRPIGALYHVPHGLSNAILLVKCLNFLKEGAVERLAELAKAINVFVEGMSDEEAATAFVDAIDKLLVTLEIPAINELKVDKDYFFSNLDKMAKDAIDSGSPGNTRKVPSHADLVEIYKDLWR